MTDTQMLLAIKLRVPKRLSNFVLINVLNEMIRQSKEQKLELEIFNKFIVLCKIYNIKLDAYDMDNINIERQANLTDTDRKLQLRKAGLGI